MMVSRGKRNFEQILNSHMNSPGVETSALNRERCGPTLLKDHQRYITKVVNSATVIQGDTKKRELLKTPIKI